MSDPLFTSILNQQLDRFPDQRISAFRFDGRKFWIKRRERLSFRMRLQKGNAADAFEKERAALRDLSGRDLPIAELIAKGDDWMVLPDHGPSLFHLLRSPVTEPNDRLLAFRTAGLSLAALHDASVTHGRASVRDICWDGTAATFIDFERYSRDRNTLRGQAFDVVSLVFSSLSASPQNKDDLAAMIAAYRTARHRDIWPLVMETRKRFRWANRVVKPLLPLGARRFNDLAAVPLTLTFLKSQAA